MHRIILFLAIFCALTTALQIPDLQPFLTAIPLFGYSVDNATQHELQRRQNTACPTSYNNCANLGAPGLCCAATAVCSADFLGHVACCRSGVACSGTIGAVITGGTLDSNGNLVGASATTTGTGTATSTSNGLVGATTTTTTPGATTTTAATATGGGFIIASNTVVAQPGAATRAEIVSKSPLSLSR